MALTKECEREMERLLTLVEHQKQYRTGVVFPSRMNNYFYDAGTGKILRLQDDEYRLLKALFFPKATVQSVTQAFSEEDPDAVETFLRNTAQYLDRTSVRTNKRKERIKLAGGCITEFYGSGRVFQTVNLHQNNAIAAHQPPTAVMSAVFRCEAYPRNIIRGHSHATPYNFSATG